jgi:hypothetical protein
MGRSDSIHNTANPTNFELPSLADSLNCVRVLAAPGVGQKVKNGCLGGSPQLGFTIIQLLTFYEFPRAMWKSIRTTNALENLNREFRRRTKIQASFSAEDAAVTLLFGLLASGQSCLRRIDGYKKLPELMEAWNKAA